jgi:hypothetical protein
MIIYQIQRLDRTPLPSWSLVSISISAVWSLHPSPSPHYRPYQLYLSSPRHSVLCLQMNYSRRGTRTIIPPLDLLPHRHLPLHSLELGVPHWHLRKSGPGTLSQLQLPVVVPPPSDVMHGQGIIELSRRTTSRRMESYSLDRAEGHQ